jgi:hypothetical protein
VFWDNDYLLLRGSHPITESRHPQVLYALPA